MEKTQNCGLHQCSWDALSYSASVFSDVNSLFWYRRLQYGAAVHVMLVEARAADCSKCATSYSQQDCCVDVTSPFRATV
ncbi:uncharacterized protein LOC144116223 isoform X2 [Amblyomma americanum]